VLNDALTLVFVLVGFLGALLALRNMMRRGRTYSQKVSSVDDRTEADLITARYLQTSSRVALAFSAGFGLAGFAYVLALVPVRDIWRGGPAAILVWLGLFTMLVTFLYATLLRIAMSYLDGAWIRQVGLRYRLVYAMLSHGTWRYLSPGKGHPVWSDAKRPPWRVILLVASGLAVVFAAGLLISGQGAMIPWAVGGVIAATAILCIGLALTWRD